MCRQLFISKLRYSICSGVPYYLHTSIWFFTPKLCNSIRSVPLRIQLHIELHNSIRSVVLRIELRNVERTSCLHFYENTTYPKLSIDTYCVCWVFLQNQVLLFLLKKFPS